jgi:hypothetical protein
MKYRREKSIFHSWSLEYGRRMAEGDQTSDFGLLENSERR